MSESAASTIKIFSRYGGIIGEFPGATIAEALANAVVSDANLRDADLRDADLRDANLRDAKLSGADLSGANLSDADLSGADLSDADLSDADLSDADLSGADLSDADLSDADLSGAELSGADLSDADLRDADLRDANLRDAKLSGAELSDANLRDADLSGANLSGAKLSGANLSGAKLSGARQFGTPAEWCALHGVAVVDGVAMLYKAVESDWRATHKTTVTYKPGAMPEAPDWDGGKQECGKGLHFSPRPRMARHFLWFATHFIACKVRLEDMSVHPNGDYPQKCKAARVCAPCVEVDIDGNEIGAAA